MSNGASTTRTCITATTELSEEVYHSVSQLTLDAINETLEDFADDHGEGGEVDVECAADVLSLALGDAKFVLNKQERSLFSHSPTLPICHNPFFPIYHKH